MPKLNPELYGEDMTSYPTGIAERILGNPSPTLDINGEKDERAVSEGNHGTQGGGRGSQGEKSGGMSGGGGEPSKDGGT
jgi:hypothetical protein